MVTRMGSARTEKRKHPRMPAGYELFATCEGQTFMTRSRDVSPQGIGIYCNESLAAGSVNKMTLLLPDRALSLELWGVVCHCVQNPDYPSIPFSFLAGIKFNEESLEGIPFLQIQGEVMRYAASHSVLIEASARDCYQFLCDFERYPEWAKILEQVQVRDRYPDGRPRRVEFVANAYLRKVRYVLDYAYDDPKYCLSWVNSGGDFLSITGRYFFLSQRESATASTYELSVTANFPLPKRIIRYFSSIAMRKTMKDFKHYVESKLRREARPN